MHHHNAARKKRYFFSRFLKNKKGLSEVVTNLLIILLVLVAIGVVWFVIRNLISSGAEEIELGRFTFDISIRSAYVNGSDIVVGIRRNAGGGSGLLGMNLIFTNETDSIIIERRGFLQEREIRTFTFTSAELPGIGAEDEVFVSPIYDSSGKEKIGNPTDSAIISGTPPTGTGGNGGNGGGGQLGTGFCSDGTIQSPNSDSINEECDGTNLAGMTCLSLGLGGGTLSCTVGCQFDTSQCIGATPASCDGVWSGTSEDLGVECDGTPLPNGCSASCTCEQGFTANGVGGCNLNPPLDTGTIFSVWNNIYFDSNNLPKSDTVTGFIGDYANFSSSPEVGCFLITFADYIVENDISYLRVSDSLGAPNIAAGQGYSVWAAENCGQ